MLLLIHVTLPGLIMILDWWPKIKNSEMEKCAISYRDKDKAR